MKQLIYYASFILLLTSCGNDPPMYGRAGVRLNEMPSAGNPKVPVSVKFFCDGFQFYSFKATLKADPKGTAADGFGVTNIYYDTSGAHPR